MFQKISREDNYLLQVLSFVYGFLLILLLSIDEKWSSSFVVTIIVLLSSIECLWLRRIKSIDSYHWLSSNWLLLASSVVYIVADGFFVKTIMFSIMILSVYLSLYRTVYYEPFSVGYIKLIIKDFPILCFSYMAGLLKRNEYLKIREKKERRFVGICILLVFLIGIFLPLYMAMDNRMGLLLEFVIIKIITYLPIWIISALLGIIPAIINYSIVRGLVEDIVLNNPSRAQKTIIYEFDDNNIFWNNTIINIVLSGLSIVNVVAIGLQISSLFNQIMEKVADDILYNMEREFPLLIAIVIGALFVIISQYWIAHCKSKSYRLKLVFLYNVSLIALLLLLISHYVLKVSKYGVAETDLYVIYISILLGMILVLLVLSYICKNEKMIQKIVSCSVILFVILSLFPSEYLIAQINVQVFLNRYRKSEIVNQVTVQDIDLKYLEKMQYEAVPALMLLVDIPVEYEGTQEVLGKSANDIILDMFYRDMSDEEIGKIESLDSEYRKDELVAILSEKVEYQVIGRKKIALLHYCEN